MNTTDPEVREYLAELRRALATGPLGERELVVDGVRQHIDDALASGVPVQQVLEDLGDPLVIAAAAGGPAPAASPVPGFLERRSGSVLVALLIAFGGLVVPVAGWIVGVVLLWASKGWRTVDKVVGTVASPVLVVLVVFGAHVFSGVTSASAAAPSGGQTSLGPLLPEAYDVTWTVLLLLPMIQIGVAVYLLLRFRPAR